jgi:cytoskeletal protein CcmA (bactofilin family)
MESEARLEQPPSSANRRFTDSVHPSVTVVGPGTRVRGDLGGSDPVEIRGTLEGSCQTSAHCVVHPGARVAGDIAAAGLVVAGEVEGGTISADKVEISATGRVRAKIRARVIAIADGALYDGEVQMEGPGAADGPLFFKDQRKGAGVDVVDVPAP